MPDDLHECTSGRFGELLGDGVALLLEFAPELDLDQLAQGEFLTHGGGKGGGDPVAAKGNGGLKELAFAPKATA